MFDITQEQQRIEAFERLERESWRVDELTYASEALAAPMDNPFEYELREGELWYKGRTIRSHLEEGIVAAENIAAQYSQFRVELLRRHIELQEYEAQVALACAAEGEPDLLIVISPIPDAVVSGVELGAYDVDRLKALVRIYVRTDVGITARSMSLDGSDLEGFRAIASRFNQTIPDGASSEDILQMRLIGWADELEDEPSVVVRREYDRQLAIQYGGEWYAGRQDDTVLNALEFITAQEDLVLEHMNAVTVAKRSRLSSALKQLRYDFVEALSRRLRGDPELSMSEAGDIARAAGIEHKTDCPDGDGLGKMSGMIEQMGFGIRTITSRFCPICGSESITTLIDGEMIRGVECGCSRNVCTGTIVRGPGRQSTELAKHEQTSLDLRAWKKEMVIADQDDQQRKTIQAMEQMLHDMPTLRDATSFQATTPHSKPRESHGPVAHETMGDVESMKGGFSLDFGRLATYTRIEIGGGERVTRNVLTGEEVEEDVA